MKKIALTESQAQRLVDTITEQVPATRAIEYSINDGRYYVKCEFYFDHSANEYVVYKGGEIIDIDLGYGNVSFMIEIDHAAYGIKGLQIKDIQGPKTIKTQITYLPPGSTYEDEDYFDKKIEENIEIPLNWKNIEIDEAGKYREMDYFGVYKNINVDIVPDGRGGIMGGKMEIEINHLPKIE